MFPYISRPRARDLRRAYTRTGGEKRERGGFNCFIECPAIDCLRWCCVRDLSGRGLLKKRGRVIARDDFSGGEKKMCNVEKRRVIVMGGRDFVRRF